MKLWFFLSIALIVSSQSHRIVRCDIGEDLVSVLDQLKEATLIEIRGDCIINSPATVKIDGHHLIAETGYTAQITANGDFTTLFVNGARKVIIENITLFKGTTGLLIDFQGGVMLKGAKVNEGITGVKVAGQSSLQLDDVSIDGSSNAALLASENSAVVLLSTLVITNSDSFGLIVSESSSFTFRKNARATLTGNALGVQINCGSSCFMDEGSSLLVTQSDLLGVTVTVGATMTLFRANVETSHNGLDGVSISLGGTLFIDQTSSWISDYNLRDGVRVEEAIVRLSNLGQPGPDNLGPFLQTNTNGRRGISVGRDSFLDLQSSGPTRGLQSSGNSQSITAGGDLWVDYGSSCSLRSSSVGLLVAGFESLLDIDTTSVTNIVCDGTVKTRGAISCP